MATVTGMTAAAMEAIRDGTVVSAAFDSANHLILTKYDGSQVDAGVVADSSVTVKGLVELATTAETTTGTDTVRAVTPSGLAAVKALLLSLTGGTLTGALNSTLTAITDVVHSALIGGDTVDRFRLYASGKQEHGSGSAARDANWYRSAAGVMKTDTAIAAGTSMAVGTDLSVGGVYGSGTNFNTSAWVTYTPTWQANTTAPVLGNGTLTGRYQRIGRTILLHINLIPGSTTTFGSGGYFFNLPFTSANVGASWIGSAQALLVSRWNGTCVVSPNATTLAPFYPTSSSNGIATQLGAGAPETMAAGHQVRMTIMYEAAS